MQLENINNHNEKDNSEDSHLLHLWQPCKFEITEDFNFVNDNFIFNIFSNLLYIVAYPLLILINKFLFNFKIEGKKIWKI